MPKPGVITELKATFEAEFNYKKSNTYEFAHILENHVYVNGAFARTSQEKLSGFDCLVIHEDQEIIALKIKVKNGFPEYLINVDCLDRLDGYVRPAPKRPSASWYYDHDLGRVVVE